MRPLIFMFATCASIISAAQTLPTTQPSTIVTPAGFVRFDVAGRTFISLSADREWITHAVSNLPKPKPPTTEPSAMLGYLRHNRHQSSAAILSDLPMLSPAQLDSYLDQRVIPLAQKLSTMDANLVYLIAPMDSVKEAMRRGWTCEQLHYNRAADTIEPGGPVAFGQPGQTDESIVAIILPTDESPDLRNADLASKMRQIESLMSDGLTSRASELMANDLHDFIANKALTDLPGRDDQIWLKDGLSVALAAKYTAILYGASVSSFLPNLDQNPRTAPINPATLDLLHPPAADQIVPQMLNRYVMARHMKAGIVMNHWLRRAGDKQILPLIAAVKQSHPADGESLAKLVSTTSGIDLTAELQGQ